MNGEGTTAGVLAFVAKRSEHSLVEEWPGRIITDYVGRSVSVFEDRIEFDVVKTGFTKYLAFWLGPVGSFIGPSLAALSGAPLRVTIPWQNVRQVVWKERGHKLTVWGAWDNDGQLWSCTVYLRNDDFDRVVRTLRETQGAAHALATAPSGA